MGEWISVKNRLPPSRGKKYLVARIVGNNFAWVISIAFFDRAGRWFDPEINKTTDVFKWWMPLPEPPVQEGGES